MKKHLLETSSLSVSIQPGENMSTKNDEEVDSPNLKNNFAESSHSIDAYVMFKSINNVTKRTKVCLDVPISTIVKDISESLESSLDTHDIKLIYSGKLLSFDNSLSFYGIKEDHVVLYMLKPKEGTSNNPQPTESTTASASNLAQSPSTAGFNSLVNYGFQEQDINLLRLLYQASYLAASRTNSGASASNQAQMEEEFIRRLYQQNDPQFPDLNYLQELRRSIRNSTNQDSALEVANVHQNLIL